MSAKKIYLSYARVDSEIIPSIVEKLREHQPTGQEVVVNSGPEHIFPGKDFRQQIQEKIQESDEVMLIWTAGSAASSFVNYEAGIADALGKPITVVMPDESAPGLPINLTGVKLVKLI